MNERRQRLHQTKEIQGDNTDRDRGSHADSYEAEVEDMVDAALVGLDLGELVTIPGLHSGDEWTRFEAARRAMLPQFGTSVPAPRYRNQARRSA